MPGDDGPIHGLMESRRYAEAFEAIMRAYQNKVFRLSYAILGNHALAEESAQEALLRVWRAIETYNGKASLSTWIFTIARNTALTLREQHARRMAVPLADAPEPAAAEAGVGGDPELSRAIGDLPEHYRRAILLFHMEEKSYEETAAMLGLPLGTVKTHLHRARRLLADALAGPMMKVVKQ